jgi:hypothetical protein
MMLRAAAIRFENLLVFNLNLRLEKWGSVRGAHRQAQVTGRVSDIWNLGVCDITILGMIS